ncbi:MAG: hypothetical protein ACLSBB_17650 [Ruthenibacterium lactatiformans]
MNHRTDKFGGSLEAVPFCDYVGAGAQTGGAEMVIDYKFAVDAGTRQRRWMRQTPKFARWLEAGADMPCGAGQSYRQYGGYHPAYGRTAYGFCGHCRAGEGVWCLFRSARWAHYRPMAGDRESEKDIIGLGRQQCPDY